MVSETITSSFWVDWMPVNSTKTIICSWPHEISLTLLLLKAFTSVGHSYYFSFPCPNCPCSFSPQVNNSPSSDNAAENNFPVSISMIFLITFSGSNCVTKVGMRILFSRTYPHWNSSYEEVMQIVCFSPQEILVTIFSLKKGISRNYCKISKVSTPLIPSCPYWFLPHTLAFPLFVEIALW